MRSPSPAANLPIGAALGIDFGTSHTIAVVRRADGGVRPLLFDGSPLMPSAVCADGEGAVLVGRDAVHGGRRRPDRFEPNPKRHLDHGSVLLGDRDFPVVDLIAAVLRAVNDECRRVVGAPGAVTVTVPAEWGPARRAVVADAAVRAGLGRVRLVPEPVAAATYFAMALKHDIATGASVIVYDLGAGTFDASVVRRAPDGFTTDALDGRADLGGLDIDAALVAHLAGAYGDHPDWRRLVTPSTVVERRAYREFLDEIRGAKERLSRHQQSDVSIPLLDVEAHLTRGELDAIAAPHLERTVQVTRDVVRTAGLDPAASAGLFLVGGASRMPLVATMLHREFGIAPTVLDQPEVVVAEGSLLWTESAPVAAPQPPPAPALPPPAPSPVASSPPATTPPPRAPGPAAPAVTTGRRRFGRRIVMGVIVADILIVALLIGIFRPWSDDTDADGAESGVADAPELLGQALADTAAYDQFGQDLDAHDGAVTATVATDGADGPLLYTAGADRTVVMWDAVTGEPLAEHAFTHDVNAMALREFSDGVVRVLAVDGRLGLHMWEPGGLDVATLSDGNTNNGQLERVTVGLVDGHVAVAAMAGDQCAVFDVETGADLGQWTFTDEQTDAYRNFAVVDGAMRLVTAAADGSLRLYDAVTGDPVGDAFGPDPSSWDTESSRVGGLRVVEVDGVAHAMVYDTLRGRFHTYDLEERTSVYGASTLDAADAWYVRETADVDGEQVFLAFAASTNANLYSLDSGRAVDVFEAASGEAISAASFGDVDGYTIAVTGAADGSVQLWSMEG